MSQRNDEQIWWLVDQRRDRYISLSDRIWGMPELCYQEHRSAAEHVAMLEAEGFRITRNIAGIPTAMMGEAGEGGPVVAILGEFDALPGLSQEAGAPEQRPLPGNGNGHGCGHNLLGSAALLAAAAVKDWLKANKLPGRVRCYGCPAEEGGGAKGFMVRDGAFDDVDVEPLQCDQVTGDVVLEDGEAVVELVDLRAVHRIGIVEHEHARTAAIGIEEQVRLAKRDLRHSIHGMSPVKFGDGGRRAARTNPRRTVVWSSMLLFEGGPQSAHVVVRCDEQSYADRNKLGKQGDCLRTYRERMCADVIGGESV